MSKLDATPTYSESGLSARALFYDGCGDVNIYIEDFHKEYICEQILERLFDGKLKFRAVLGLGGKTAVLSRCRTAGAYESDGKPNIFIVDGDFDNLWDEQKENLPGLIYLTRYNIESYYCSENTVVPFLRMYLGRKGDEIEEFFHYREWEESFFREAKPLFLLFALVKKYLPEMPNVGKADSFLDLTGHVCPRKYEAYRQEIVAILGDTTPYMREIESQIERKITGNQKEQLQMLICGKYETKSLYHCIRASSDAKKVKNLKYEYLLNHLILQIEPSPLAFLKDFIQAQLAGTRDDRRGIA